MQLRLMNGYSRLFEKYIKKQLGKDTEITNEAETVIEIFLWDALIYLIYHAFEYKPKGNITLQLENLISAYRDLPDEFVISPGGEEKMFERTNEISRNKQMLQMITRTIIKQVTLSTMKEGIRITRFSNDDAAFVDSYITTLIKEIIKDVVDNADIRGKVGYEDVYKVLRSANLNDYVKVWVVTLENAAIGEYDSFEEAYSGTFDNLLQDVRDNEDLYREWLGEEELEDNDKNRKLFLADYKRKLVEVMKSWLARESFQWEGETYRCYPLYAVNR